MARAAAVLPLLLNLDDIGSFGIFRPNYRTPDLAPGSSLPRDNEMCQAPRSAFRYAFNQSTLCSYAYAIFSGVESSKCRAMIIIPTGSPFDFAHGTLIAG